VVQVCCVPVYVQSWVPPQALYDKARPESSQGVAPALLLEGKAMEATRREILNIQLDAVTPKESKQTLAWWGFLRWVNSRSVSPEPKYAEGPPRFRPSDTL